MLVRAIGAFSILLAMTLIAAAAAGPQIVFEQESHNYGDVLYGKTVTAEFTFTNAGDKTLVIEKLRASCGCTKALQGSREVPPGAKSKIVAEFDTDGLSAGAKKKTISVHSNDPKRPVVTLNLLANVVKEVTVEPHLLINRLTGFQEKVSFPMKISNASKQPITIKSVHVTDAVVSGALKPERIVIDPGADVPFDIEMTFTEEAGRRFYSGSILLKTDHPAEKEINIKYVLQLNKD